MIQTMRNAQIEQRQNALVSGGGDAEFCDDRGHNTGLSCQLAADVDTVARMERKALVQIGECSPQTRKAHVHQ